MGLLHHWVFLFVLSFKTVYFIYLVLAAWTFSSCSEQGYSVIAVCRLLTVVASLVGQHRF